MPSNLLIFDAEYVSELTSRMNTACELMAEAVSSLKSASAHENWKCKERTRILDDFDELNLKLGRLNGGVNETTRILGGSVSRFAALESQYESQAKGLYDELTSNHGYAASVMTDEPSAQPGQSSHNPNSQPSSAAQSTDADPTAGATTEAVGGAGASHHRGAKGQGAGVASAMAGRLAGKAGAGPNNPSPSANAQGETMNVNLPVTHIPDNPDAAARGINDTRAVAEAAVHITVRTIAAAFASCDTGNAIQLAEAYNAGRSIFENSSAIIDSPTQPHTAERIAMAAGIFGLAGSTVAGAAVLGQIVGAASTAGSTGGGSLESRGSWTSNARSIQAAVQGNSEAGEFSNVLGVFTESGSSNVPVSNSSSGKMSFFDIIVNALKKAISGEGAGGSSSSLFSSSSAGASSTSSMSESSPVVEFLNKFVMDQA